MIILISIIEIKVLNSEQNNYKSVFSETINIVLDAQVKFINRDITFNLHMREREIK